MSLENLKPLQIKQIIRSELRQRPETRWIQNLRHPSYQLRHPIPILIENGDDAVTASYADLNLCSTGNSVETAISDLCTKIVVYYEGVRENVNLTDNAPTQEYAFLKQLIAETQPKIWEEVKQLYQERLRTVPYVQQGYINISAPEYADILIILTGESVERIKQLAQIDLDLNLKFSSLCLNVEYEHSTDFLNLHDFERFY